MKNIENKLICLTLNSSWQPVGAKTVKEAFISLCGGGTNGKPSELALNIEYGLNENGELDLSKPKSIVPVSWSEWVNLPINSWDLTISTPNREIRIPTVVIAVNFSRMPFKTFNGNPSKEGIFRRDKGRCQYTGKELDRNSFTLDHVIPRSRGGQDVWTNLVACDREINTQKGNKLNSEAGLRLLKQPSIPRPIPVSALITEAKHVDWSHFLIA